MVVTAAHGLSQFVPGSVIGLGFQGLLPAALGVCNLNNFLQAHHWGSGVAGSNPAVLTIFPTIRVCDVARWLCDPGHGPGIAAK